MNNVISIAAGFKTTVLNRLILFEQILAIENDPHFNGGDYYDAQAPLYGLALARMISHKTFVHLDAIENRARQDVVQPDDVLAWYRVRDQFQSYMLHQGKKFVAPLRREHLPADHRHVVALRCHPRGRCGNAGGSLRARPPRRPALAGVLHRFRLLFLSGRAGRTREAPRRRPRSM